MHINIARCNQTRRSFICRHDITVNILITRRGGIVTIIIVIICVIVIIGGCNNLITSHNNLIGGIINGRGYLICEQAADMHGGGGGRVGGNRNGRIDRRRLLDDDDVFLAWVRTLEDLLQQRRCWGLEEKKFFKKIQEIDVSLYKNPRHLTKLPCFCSKLYFFHTIGRPAKNSVCSADARALVSLAFVAAAAVVAFSGSKPSPIHSTPDLTWARSKLWLSGSGPFELLSF